MLPHTKRKIRRILVIKNRAIGDTVLLTGCLRLLKKHHPNHDIHVMVRSPSGQILEGLPYVDRIISSSEPASKMDRAAYWMRIINTLREKHYEVVLNFHASFRTALTMRLLRADCRVANHHELRGRNWFSDLRVPGRGVVKPIIERDLDVLRAIGIEASLEQAMPEIVLNAYERHGASDLLEKKAKNQDVNLSKKQKLLFLGLGAGRETKKWPASHVVQLMKKVLQSIDVQFVTATVQSDRVWLKEFQALLAQEPEVRKSLLHFEGVALRQAAAILSHCHSYIGNDSGLKHMAVALGLSTFTFFGPEAPLEWHPYNTRSHGYGFIEQMPCRTETGKHWCAIAACEKHQHRCMQDLTVDKVWPDLQRIIRGENRAD